MSDVSTNPGWGSPGVYQLAPAPRPWPQKPPTSDALTDPAVDDLAESFWQLLPPGAAWRTPDGAAFEAGSMLGGFWRAIASGFAVLYRRIAGILRESTASTLVDGLDDWEAEYGLPDPCFGIDQSRAQRLRALLAKVRSKGTITPADFVALAGSIGYTIEIREPRVFTTGFSACGGPDGTGSAANFFWIVKLTGRASKRFETGLGLSMTGRDPLLDVAQATDLECLFRALAPAWTRVIFDYS